MARNPFFRGFARIIIVVIIATCARYLPLSYSGWVTGFVGCIVVDIYGILIEKGKL